MAEKITKKIAVFSNLKKFLLFFFGMKKNQQKIEKTAKKKFEKTAKNKYQKTANLLFFQFAVFSNVLFF